MRRKIGVFCVVVGAVLMLAALSLFVYNRQESEQALESANEVLAVLEPQIEENADTIGLYGESIRPSSRSDDESDDKQSEDEPIDALPTMDTIEVDGWLYIGTLSIPRLGVELPIMSEWSYTGLRIAPGRYAGSAWTDDLVICGHNYTRHFGGLRNLEYGDSVIFTDVYGAVYEYRVVEVTVLQPTAIEEMISGGWDLTLFTCTYGGQARVTVRCERVG